MSGLFCKGDAPIGEPSVLGNDAIVTINRYDSWKKKNALHVKHINEEQRAAKKEAQAWKDTPRSPDIHIDQPIGSKRGIPYSTKEQDDTMP